MIIQIVIALALILLFTHSYFDSNEKTRETKRDRADTIYYGRPR